MRARTRAVCLHGHYYQPPREHPWLGVVEPEPSAAPDHDWNARILRECYAANAQARLLDARGRLRAVHDNYAWTSFDFGPTLLSWAASEAPDLVRALVAADRASRDRTGHGNAWAQAYNHPILPLCTARDVVTEVRWGAREFELRFGRRPEGMWLPEMAVDLRALEALAAEGIAMTLLSPHQARRVRPLGADDAAWRDVTAETLVTRRLYRCRLPSGRAVDVAFRDATLSQGLAFGELLPDGGTLAARLRGALEARDGDELVCAAADGETFGHHHHFGDMAVAYALEQLHRAGDVELTNPMAVRDAAPPRDEVEIVERSSWSCAHGVERWRADCGCHLGGSPGWTQAWRAPLRAAIDALRDDLAAVFEREGGTVLRDPWGARERWIDAVVDPARADAALAPELRPGASAVAARRALELARHALLMQTSCGWFFDDVAGVEGIIVLRQAGRALDLARALGARGLEDAFLDRLAAARSNRAEAGSAADVYRRVVLGRPVTWARIAASAVLAARAGAVPDLPGYDVAQEPRGDGFDVTIRERATGAAERVHVAVGEGLAGEAEGRRYTVGNLFLVQRDALLRRVTAEALASIRVARRTALERLRGVIDPLLERDPAIPPELAAIMGYEEAERLLADLDENRTPHADLVARVEHLHARGVVFPPRLLAEPLTARLVVAVEATPLRTTAAHAILDLAEAATVALDMADAQVKLLQRLPTTPKPFDDATRKLCDRLGLSPEVTGEPAKTR